MPLTEIRVDEQVRIREIDELNGSLCLKRAKAVNMLGFNLCAEIG
jgi:hypothetical protein